MAIELRTWYDEPGDPLLIPVHLFDHSLDLVRFSEDSGISPDNLVVSNLVTFPIPKKFTVEGPRGVEGLKPEFLAHPLVWLPRRLAGAYILARDEQGRPTTVEGKDHHMVRIAVEMITSGLYDEVEGKWVDCFALMNLDPRDPATIERARDWLAGSEDIAFDTFSLNDYLSADEMVADTHASDMMEFLYTEAWALQSHSLNQLVTDLTTGQVGEIPARVFGRNIASWALECLPKDAIPGASEWTFWDEFDDQLETLSDEESDQEAVMAVLEAMGAQLWAVREYYWAIREENHAAVIAEAEKEGVTKDMLTGVDQDTAWVAPEPEQTPAIEAAPAQVLALPAAPAQELEDPFAEEQDQPDVELEDPFAEEEPQTEGEELEDPFADEEPQGKKNANDNFVW